MKKNLLIGTLVIAAAAFSLASCGESVTVDQKSDGNSNAVLESIPEVDEDGFKIEVVEVTDAAGEVVRGEDNKPVTELAIVDDKGAVITDTNGQAAKPNIPVKPAGNSNNSNNNNNNNNSNNNNSNNNNNNSNNTPEAAAPVDNVAFLWFGDSKKVDSELVFDPINSDGEVMELVFKVKENAKDGKYEIRYLEDSNHATSFCDKSVNNIPITFCNGFIGVNESVSETQAGSGTSFVVSSASAKPGDTVTLKCSLKNVTTDIIAFNSYLAYDASALEPVAVNGIGLIDSYGELTTNIHAK